MYKYYSLERPVSIGTFPKNCKLIAFKNFESSDSLVKKELNDNGKRYNAWGYLLTENPLSHKEVDDYELADAGKVVAETKINDLPDDLQEDIRYQINRYYKKISSEFQMVKAAFDDIYGTFTLDDFCKMMPDIAVMFAFNNKEGAYEN